MKRAALYARVATDDCLDGKFLERQVALLCEYAHLHDYDITNVYKELGSGLKEDRSELQRLMRDAATSMFDVVLLKEPSRLFRDLTLYQKYADRLRHEYGVDLIFVRRSTDETGGDS